MRISELTTRSAKLNTGTAYFPVDQSSDTVTKKIDYAELAKQIITEYNTQTLAGAAQSVKAALDTIGSTSLRSIGDLSKTAIPDLTTFLSLNTGLYRVANAAWVTAEFLPEGYGILEVVKSGGSYAYMRLTTGAGIVYERTFNAETKAWIATEWEKKVARSDIATMTGFNNITTQVSSLDDVPLNTYGLVGLPADLSPTGTARQFFYECYGISTRATLDLINVGTTNSGRYFAKKESANWGDWQPVISQVQLDALLTRKEILIRTSDFTQTIDLTGSWGVYAIVTVPRGNNGFQIFIVSKYDSTHAYIIELYSTPDLGDTYKITATLDESANVVIGRAGAYTTYINVILLKLK